MNIVTAGSTPLYGDGRSLPRRRPFRVVLSVLLSVLAMLLMGCDRQSAKESQEPQETVPPAAQATVAPKGIIVALGDSLTAGYGIDPDESYPAQLGRRLQADGHHYQVVNSGVSGETTSGTLSRLAWVLSLGPDIVILEIGANDGLRGIDPAVPAANLRQIVEKLRQDNIIVVFTGMKMVWNLGAGYTRAFNAIYPRIASEEQLIFMPFFLQDVATVPTLNIEDGLHPNAAGYRQVVENLYPYVLEAIRRFEERNGR
ncbi:MAG: arylesterase [Desulfopila sp.]